MVLDGAKGIESQTRKLFEVCRHRRIPIFTFINKLDRPSRANRWTYSMNWRKCWVSTHSPSTGRWAPASISAVSTTDCPARSISSNEHRGAPKAPVAVSELSDPMIQDHMDSIAYHRFKEEIEILEAVGTPFDPSAILSGETHQSFSAAR